MYTAWKTVFTTFSRVGFHRWPDAPEEVLYLRMRHRHKFNFRVEVSVNGDDREIEFHMMKRELEGWLSLALEYNEYHEMELDNGSCEWLAQLIVDHLVDVYPDREFYQVRVDEDGENGAIIEWIAQP